MLYPFPVMPNEHSIVKALYKLVRRGSGSLLTGEKARKADGPRGRVAWLGVALVHVRPRQSIELESNARQEVLAVLDDHSSRPLSKVSPMARPAAESNPDAPSTDDHLGLLTEHFGFSPRVFIDDIFDAANEHLYSIAAQFEDYIKEQLRRQEKKRKDKKRGRAETDAEAEQGIHTLLTLMENALDTAFDTLEFYSLKRVFGIRPSQARCMTLAHHRGVDLRSAVEKARDGDLGGIDAEEEHMQIRGREEKLQMQLDKANKRRHALILRNAIASESLLRTKQLSQSFSVLMTRRDGSQQLPSVLAESARKLSADASSLIRAMDLLISTDSLGASLLSTEGIKGNNEGNRKRVMEESGASEQEKRDWEQGREQYINWEIDRIYKSVRQQRSSDVGNQSRMSLPSSLKRRKTDENSSQVDAVGDTAELEQLAEHLNAG